MRWQAGKGGKIMRLQGGKAGRVVSQEGGRYLILFKAEERRVDALDNLLRSRKNLL